MGKLKIKDIEGEFDDINEFFSVQNCDLPSYLGVEKKQNKIPILWIGTIAVIFFILCCCIYTGILDTSWNKVAILGVFFLCFLIVGLFYYNFKNAWITAISFVACLSVISLSLNVYSPKEMTEKIEQITTKKFGNSK